MLDEIVNRLEMNVFNIYQDAAQQNLAEPESRLKSMEEKNIGVPG